MKIPKPLKIFFGLLILITILFQIISINHPILIKWMLGSARSIGKPLQSIVYVNGRIFQDFKVFHIDKYWKGEPADYYILIMNNGKKRNIFSANKKDNYVGLPSGQSLGDYDIVCEHLFQSDVGAHFSSFDDPNKGYGFNPNLAFRNNQIILNIPSTSQTKKYDSILVNL